MIANKKHPIGSRRQGARTKLLTREIPCKDIVSQMRAICQDLESGQAGLHKNLLTKQIEVFVMSRTKEQPVKRRVYLVDVDEQGNTINRPWEEVPEEERRMRWRQAVDRAMECIGYRPATEAEIAQARAEGFI